MTSATTTKDRRLGKGLAALLGTPLDDDGNPIPEAERSGVESLELSVNEIEMNPFQPRREFNLDEIASLAESIKNHQQLQPILVRIVDGRYQLISGERRLRATIHAGLSRIRAEVREADDRLVAELAIIENLQRKDLNPIEKAMSFKRYIDEHKCKQDDLARRLCIDRSTIANLMRLLELPETNSELAYCWRNHRRSRASVVADRRRGNPNSNGPENHRRSLERTRDRKSRR